MTAMEWCIVLAVGLAFLCWALLLVAILLDALDILRCHYHSRRVLARRRGAA